jgi:hypothetical protein
MISQDPYNPIPIWAKMMLGSLLFYLLLFWSMKPGL